MELEMAANHSRVDRYRMAPELLDAELDLTEPVMTLAVRQVNGARSPWAAMEAPLLTAGQEPVLAFWIEAAVLAQQRLEDKTRLLGGTDRAALNEVIRRGANAKDRMVRSNIRLVLFVAVKRVAGRDTGSLEFDDVVAAGATGLTHAIEMFDYRLGWKFSTYATNWIQQSIDRAIGKSAAMSISEHDRAHLSDLRHLRQERQQACLPAPSVAQVCERLQLGRRAARDLLLLERSRVPASLDKQLGDSGSTLGDLIPDAANVETSMESDVQTAALEQALASLSERERRVVCARVGWVDGRPSSEDEIAARLGVSPGMVRRVGAAALHKLRQALGAEADQMAVAA